jgi:hypothetical protein
MFPPFVQKRKPPPLPGAALLSLHLQSGCENFPHPAWAALVEAGELHRPRWRRPEEMSGGIRCVSNHPEPFVGLELDSVFATPRVRLHVILQLSNSPQPISTATLV